MTTVAPRPLFTPTPTHSPMPDRLGASSASGLRVASRDMPLVNGMLAAPLQFGPSMTKSTFASTAGVREIMPGPSSPPAGLLQLQPPSRTPSQIQTASTPPASPLSTSKVNGVKGKESKVNGTVNGGVHANGNGKANGNGLVNGHGSDHETEEDEEVEEGEKGAAVPNAEAGPSQLKSTTLATRSRSPTAAVNGQVSLATPNKSESGKGKGKATETPNGASHAVNGGDQAEKQPAIHLAASKRAHTKDTLCTELDDADLAWPPYVLKQQQKYGAGLNNPSMACYANSTLQVMLHTPPLLREAIYHGIPANCEHAAAPAKGQQQGFCMLCVVRGMIAKHASESHSYSPPVHGRLSAIKKGFSKHKQEDTHEFFRFATDALQNQALYGLPKNTSDKVKHTSWVHRIWGGQVRSRVLCLKCKKPSDTFDTYLDLALDCGPKTPSVEAMLKAFIKDDRLEGDNKYHCDNCKSKSNATKSFRIAEAPPVLTLHLKRFSVSYNSYNGRARAQKFNGRIEFDEYLDIAPYMVAGSTQPTRYRLFGVTCHRGNELRYGHYTAYVKTPTGKWCMADDEDMHGVPLSKVLSDSTAYLLSYIRVTEDDAAPHANGPANGHGHGLANGTPRKVSGEKRARDDSDDEEEDEEEVEGRSESQKTVNHLVAKKPFIGPVRPNGSASAVNQTPVLFGSAFDRPSESQGGPRNRNTTPVPVPNGDAGHSRANGAEDEDDNDQDERNAASSSKFGAALSLNTSRGPGAGAGGGSHASKFKPIGSNSFYTQPKSPIQRPREPSPSLQSQGQSPHAHKQPQHQYHQHSHSHSPRSGKQGKDRRQSRKERRSNSSPYSVGGGSGSGGGGGGGGGGRGKGGFGNGRKGMQQRMKPRH